MNGRIVAYTEKLVRKLFNIEGDYTVDSCNIKKNSVEMTLTNDLITVKVKLPRHLIEDYISTLNEEE